jgi:hypothetical protein
MTQQTGQGAQNSKPAGMDDDKLLSGNDISDYRTRNFFTAYVRMAKEGRARPLGPGDGLGNSDLTEAEWEDPKRLRNEAIEFAKEMIKQDEDEQYTINGCVHGEYVHALTFALEACALMMSGTMFTRQIEKLLEMALEEIRTTQTP